MAKSRHYRKGVSRNRGNSNPADRGRSFRIPVPTHPTQFQLSRDILAFSDECLGPFEKKTQTQQVTSALIDFIIMNFGAFVSLMEHKRPFWDSAGSIVRVMFESAVNAEFFWKQPDEVLVKRYVAFEVWSRWYQFIDAIKIEPIAAKLTSAEDIRKMVHDYVEITQGDTFNWETSEISTALKFDFKDRDWDVVEAPGKDNNKKISDLKAALPHLKNFEGSGAVRHVVESALKRFEETSVPRPAGRTLRQRCEWLDKTITEELRAKGIDETFDVWESQYVVIYQHLSNFVHGMAHMVAVRLRQPDLIGHIATNQEIANLAAYANTVVLRALALAINLISKSDTTKSADLVLKWRVLHDRHTGFDQVTKSKTYSEPSLTL